MLLSIHNPHLINSRLWPCIVHMAGPWSPRLGLRIMQTDVNRIWNLRFMKDMDWIDIRIWEPYESCYNIKIASIWFKRINQQVSNWDCSSTLCFRKRDSQPSWHGDTNISFIYLPQTHPVFPWSCHARLCEKRANKSCVPQKSFGWTSITFLKVQNTNEVLTDLKPNCESFLLHKALTSVY